MTGAVDDDVACPASGAVVDEPPPALDLLLLLSAIASAVANLSVDSPSKSLLPFLLWRECGREVSRQVGGAATQARTTAATTTNSDRGRSSLRASERTTSLASLIEQQCVRVASRAGVQSVVRLFTVFAHLRTFPLSAKINLLYDSPLSAAASDRKEREPRPLPTCPACKQVAGIDQP